VGEAKEHEGGDDRLASMTAFRSSPSNLEVASHTVTNIAGIYLHRNQIIVIITQSTSGRGEYYHDRGKQDGIDNVGGDINARVYGRKHLKQKPRTIILSSGLPA